MDAWLDPSTGDYAIAQDAPVRDPANGLANAVYLRLMTPLASYWADPTLGSRVHELQREKDVARVELLARQYSEQALAPLIADRRASRIDVTTERVKVGDGSGRLQLRINVLDARSQHFVFIHPVTVL